MFLDVLNSQNLVKKKKMTILTFSSNAQFNFSIFKLFSSFTQSPLSYIFISHQPLFITSFTSFTSPPILPHFFIGVSFSFFPSHLKAQVAIKIATMEWFHPISFSLAHSISFSLSLHHSCPSSISPHPYSSSRCHERNFGFAFLF